MSRELEERKHAGVSHEVQGLNGVAWHVGDAREYFSEAG